MKRDTHDIIQNKLNRLESKQDELSRKVSSVNSELETNVLSNITKEMETMRNELLSVNSGVSEELMNLTVEIQKANSRHRQGYECGGTGGCRRVVYLDMTNPNASCPSGWQFTRYGSTRLCGKVSTGSYKCDSVLFPVTGGDYTRVCGSVRGYQYGIVDAFESYHDGDATTIDSAYVSGVSLTHGYPRQHIWTFAAGLSEDRPTVIDACPCDARINIRIPPFVGEDYFCESGDNSGSPGGFHPDDPLWDGSGCTLRSSCCTFNNPPYFTKKLPNATSDDIEARLCRLDSDYSPIEFIELYVKDIKPDNIEAKLDRLDSKQDELSMKVSSVNSELETNVLSKITKEMETMRNETKELLSVNSDVSEKLLNLTVEIQNTNSRLGQGYECGGTGDWRRVVYLDMTDPNTKCPSGWRFVTYGSKRLCEQFNASDLTCDSVLFPVTGGDYTSVCGSIRAYQNARTDAFESYHQGQATTIGSAYVSGVSLTHGSPRQHIWPFAAGSSEVTRSRVDACPCDAIINISIPPFVGGDYFCESGVNSGSYTGFHPDDPLWDGSGCATSSSCCSFNNPPYFTKRLPNPTSDDIEARLCRLDSDHSPIEFIELYVKRDTHDIIQNKLNRLESQQGELSRKVSSVNLELETNVLSNITKEMETITKTLLSLNSDVSEELLNLTVEIQKTNSRLGQAYECGGTGGWRRVVYLDMTNPNASCPSGWQFTSYDSKNLCGRNTSTAGVACDSVLFPFTTGDYTSVCGSIRAYQEGQTDAFEPYHDGQVTTIEGAYVAGVSLTHGTPRQHIWTFAAGIAEYEQSRDDACPCDASIDIRIPPFVGEDYFCESGDNSGSPGGFHPDDPLWDGSGCTLRSSCCSFNNPPYFTKQLPNPTSDDIEARLCRSDSGDDSPIEFIELYVKDNQPDTIQDKLQRLESKQDELSMKVSSVNSELETNVLSNITKEMETMRNETKELLSVNSDVSEELMNLTVEIQKTHPRLGQGYECGGTGGWRRVVYLDMTYPNTKCPSGWRFVTYGSKRLCEQFNASDLTCDSVLFPLTGGDYTSVCGSIKAYQYGATEAFESYHDGSATTIDSAYVSGVSLTHGSPRQHIWTFAAGYSEVQRSRVDACPCDASIDIRMPPFVGGDYFCESGVNSGSPGGFHLDDPLWDGSGCTLRSSCCSFNNPPYFTKRLPNPTSDDIEARLCRSDSDHSPIDFIELYVKHDTHDIIQDKLNRLESQQDELSRKVTSVNSELETNVLSNITKEMETMRNELLSVNSDVSEELQNLTVEIQKANSRFGLEERFECGGTGDWRRVVYLDMTDPNTICPSGWRFVTYDSKRLCGKVNTNGLTCDSIFFPVTRRDYTSVCGSVRAYQYSGTDAFESYHDGEATTIDSAYVSGVSLTHGSPRQHIWTFAAGSSEVTPSRVDACPCDASINISIPSFVGEDYFCESGVNSGSYSGFHPDDPLWDGSGCTLRSSCCEFNNPPYFTKKLPNPISDDIEARLCRLGSVDDSPVEVIELYVK